MRVDYHRYALREILRKIYTIPTSRFEICELMFHLVKDSTAGFRGFRTIFEYIELRKIDLISQENGKED